MFFEVISANPGDAHLDATGKFFFANFKLMDSIHAVRRIEKGSNTIMKLNYLYVIFAFALIPSSCAHRYQFDFANSWSWEQLEQAAPTEECRENIHQIQKNITLNDAQFLFKQLTALPKPVEIRRLAEIEALQEQWGGGFYGYVRAYFQDLDQIPIPNDFVSLVECALYLSKAKSEIKRVVTRTDLRYQVNFLKEGFPTDLRPPNSRSMRLNINTTSFRDVLDLFEKKKVSLKDAQKIAEDETFQQMLRSRKEIGQIPEPLPDTENLAQFVYNAASREPIHMLWKWINPWNYFCFADVFMKQANYRKLLTEIEANRDSLEALILGRITQYIPDTIRFEEQIDFAVNWGVRSWSTESRIGSNLAHVKNDYATIARTMRREVFQRLQPSICLVDPSRAHKRPGTDDDLVFWNFKNENDRQFYKTLSYILLDASAMYVGGKEPGWLAMDGAKDGRDLLDQIYVGIYHYNDPNIVKDGLDQGFTVNGPFYGLGYEMIETLVKEYGKPVVGDLLANGSVYFFKKYAALEKTFPKNVIHLLTDDIMKKIDELAVEMGI